MTYIEFAQEVMDLTETLKKNTTNMDTMKKLEILRQVAERLFKAQTKKAEYSKTHPAKSKATGASEKTLATCAELKAVLTNEFQTGAELNEAANTSYTPLQISNAMKYIDGVTSAKVVREITNAKGLTAQKEYTAYKIG